MGGKLERSKVVPIAELKEQPESKAKPSGTLREAPSIERCRPFVLEELAKALPAITVMLIDKAKAGGLAELKMLVQMSGLEDRESSGERDKRRGKSLEEMLMEDWRKEPLDESNG